ncbi:hypothetical protein ACOI1H_12990 [Loktanella sp. DJP18]
MRIVLVLATLLTASACTPARVVGNTAIGAGQVALGVVDVAI